MSEYCSIRARFQEDLHDVNIAQMSCGRHHVGGHALTILNVDSYIGDEVLDELLQQQHITWARRVSISDRRNSLN